MDEIIKRERIRSYKRNWNRKNKEYFRKYRKNNLKTIRESATRYASRNKDSQRKYALNYYYGISLDEYNEILDFQKEVCAICSRPKKIRRLAVDHEHQLKEKELRKKKKQNLIRDKVRGLLCRWCNVGLKQFQDNPVYLRKAAEYLEKWPAQQVLKKEKE